MTEQQQPNTVKTERLPVSTKVFYSLGAFSDHLMNGTIGYLAMPIYYLGLGVNPMLVSVATATPRLWDAFSDPIIANISDNAHTRFGRRKPFILIGAILTCILFVLMWSPPLGLGKTMLFVYFLVICFLYYTAYTVFAVPYHAFGLELTSDYDERTRLMGFKYVAICTCGIVFLPWIHKLCFVMGDGSDVKGVRTVSVIYACVMMAFVISPVFLCKEKFANANREKIAIFKAMKYTIKNKPYFILCMTTIISMTGVYLVAPLGYVINVTYVFGGDKEAASVMTGVYGTTYSIAALLSTPLVAFAATHLGKKRTIQAGLVLAAIGFLASWFLIYPEMPYLQLIFAIIVAPGLAALLMLVYAMIADVCDLDELNTGLRREAMYSSVYTWFMKVASAAVMAISGGILVWSKVDRDNLGITAPETIIKLRLALMLIPAAFFLIGAFLMNHYDLDKTKLQEIQAQLKENRKNRELLEEDE